MRRARCDAGEEAYRAIRRLLSAPFRALFSQGNLSGASARTAATVGYRRAGSSRRICLPTAAGRSSWTLYGEAVRWIGVALFAAGGVLGGVRPQAAVLAGWSLSSLGTKAQGLTARTCPQAIIRRRRRAGRRQVIANGRWIGSEAVVPL